MKPLLNKFFADYPVGRACNFHCLLRGLTLAAIMCGTAAVSLWCQTVPEFFGIYALDDGKLVSMIGGKGNFNPESSSIQALDYFSGKSITQSALVFKGKDLRFLVFDAAVADVSATVELYKLPYARNLITRPDQVGGLLGQVTGHPQSNTISSVQRYVIAKTDGLKIEFLQKPISNQPQMVQLVPASDLGPGIYGLFAIRPQGGQTMIFAQVFEWKGASNGSATQFCIDMLHNGGFGGMMDESDARMQHPYFLSKENYASCGESSVETPGGLSSAVGGAASGNTVNGGAAKAACNEYNGCFHEGKEAYDSGDWNGAVESFKTAADLNPTKGEIWVWLGRALLAAGRTDDFPAAWDKALALGTPISVGLCRERGIAWCERGTLVLEGKAVSFAGKSELFSIPPAEITPHGFQGDVATLPVSFFMLKVGKKDYRFDPVPIGVACEEGAAQLKCPQAGVAQQMAIGIYIMNAVPKLVNGLFGKSSQ